ncbi:hypothetical protein Tco_0846368 [Tanacetum coccineum]
MEKFPYDAHIKAIEAECLTKYTEASKDEEKLFFQMAKIEWLRKGDKNRKLFEEEATNMVIAATDKEIKEAMFGIGEEKAHGLDGVDMGERQRILEIMPFKIGTLPVKYLGIPILTKKVGINDCKQLVDKVRNKISCGVKENWEGVRLKLLGVLCVALRVNEGLLSEFITSRILYDARLDNNCSVADMISNNEWKWLFDWQEILPEIIHIPIHKLKIEKENVVKWKNKQNKLVDYSIKSTWIDLMTTRPTMNSEEEVTYSRDNAEIDVMKRKINVSNLANEWDDIFIWKERNDMMFNNGKKNAEETQKGIIDNIKLQLVCLTMKNSSLVRTVEAEWNVKFHFSK